MIKKLRVTVDGKAYDVTVEMPDDMAAPPASSRPAASAAPAAASAAAPSPQPSAPAVSAGPGSVVSPLAGKVISIETQEGASVKEGDQLLTLEAMKMNTFVFAPQNGTVEKIHIEAGANVNEGEVLISLS